MVPNALKKDVGLVTVAEDYVTVTILGKPLMERTGKEQEVVGGVNIFIYKIPIMENNTIIKIKNNNNKKIKLQASTVLLSFHLHFRCSIRTLV